jgi:hypothetical protein
VERGDAQEPVWRDLNALGVDLGGIREELPDALAHLACSLVRESDGEDLMGPDSLLEKKPNPPRDHTRFATARGGEYEQRSFEVLDSLTLGSGQVGEQIQCWGSRHWGALPSVVSSIPVFLPFRILQDFVKIGKKKLCGKLGNTPTRRVGTGPR